MPENIGTVEMSEDGREDFTIRGGAPEWLVSTAYAVNDAVHDEQVGFFYRCVQKHTSSAADQPSLDKKRTYWAKIDDGLWLPAEDTLDESLSPKFTIPSPLTMEGTPSGDDYTQTVFVNAPADSAGDHQAEVHFQSDNNPERKITYAFTITVY